MEALVEVDHLPGARLHYWQRLLLWLVTRAANVGGLVIESRNHRTRWVWVRVDPLNAPIQHLERCFRSEP